MPEVSPGRRGMGMSHRPNYEPVSRETPIREHPLAAAVQAAAARLQSTQLSAVGAPAVRTEAAPSRAAPVRAAPARVAAVRSEPVRGEPVRSEPVRGEPLQPAPLQPAPVRPATVQPAPVRPAPVRPVHAQAAPSRVAPHAAQPPARHTASAAASAAAPPSAASRAAGHAAVQHVAPPHAAPLHAAPRGPAPQAAAAAWPTAPQSAAPSEMQRTAEPPPPAPPAADPRAANPRAANPRAANPRAAEPPARRAEAPVQRAPAPPKPAPRKKAPASAALPRKALTLAYAGRQLRVGPIAFWTVVGTLVIMAGWSVVTASYFAFHDDVVTRMIARQAEVEAAYQDRIAEMRAKVDRVTTRQLLDQEQFEQKLEQVIRRQNMLDGRAGAIRGIDDDGPATTGSVPTRVPRRSSSLDPRAPEPSDGLPKPTPVGDTVVFRAPSDREARLESRRPARMLAAPGRDIRPGLEGKIARLETALDRLEQRQAHRLGSIEESYDGKVRRVRAVLADLGLDHALPPERQVGGPFVPVKLAGPAAFERRLQRVRLARAQAERLTKTLSVIPIRKPITGEVDFSSTFGVRLDPFLGRPAMHTGVDFRGHTGDPVRVTANGTVTSAGWAGGYGRMVEVDHGNGLVTRYGHMSEILVRVGQGVKIGQVVGRVGSTGRSTGPHLHYETRVDGEPVDPQKFLRAGLRIGSL